MLPFAKEIHWERVVAEVVGGSSGATQGFHNPKRDLYVFQMYYFDHFSIFYYKD